MVLFNDTELGYADRYPGSVAQMLFDGKFDKDLGFAASEWLPPTLAGWNDLGG